MFRRGQVHGRLEALEARQAARHGGPMVGWQDPLSLAVFADGGQVYDTADAFFEAGRSGNKTPVLIQRDCAASPYVTPGGAAK